METHARTKLTHALIFICCGMVLGFVGAKLVSVNALVNTLFPKIAYEHDATKRQLTAPNWARATLILYVAGQSNAANQIGVPYTPSQSVLNYFDGAYYAAQDPLLGASGASGSLAAPLADLLIQSGRYQQVILVPVAIGGTSIKQWLPGTEHFGRLAQAVSTHRDQAADKVLVWLHGERDSRERMRTETYAALLLRLTDGLHEQDNSLQVVLNLSTRCRGPALSAWDGLFTLSEQRHYLHPGLRVDKLDDCFRSDGCHFNERGQQEIARRLSQRLLEVLPGHST